MLRITIRKRRKCLIGFGQNVARNSFIDTLFLSEFVNIIRLVLFLLLLSICIFGFIYHRTTGKERSSLLIKSIEDICLFEVKSKYISSSELKISEFSRVRSMSENFDVFNSRDEIYFVFTEKKSKLSLYFIQYKGTKQAVKMRKPKKFENTNYFGTTLFLTF